MRQALELGTAETLLRVGLAVLLGGVVGIEREVEAKEAGFRTHVLLCLGAALYGMISVGAFSVFEANTADTNVRLDVTRVASQVAVGVGFLGAGTILKYRGSVRGLTTAASIWLTAAIGLAVGLGFYWPAAVVTAAALGTLIVLRWARRWIRSRLSHEEETVLLHVAPEADPSALVTALLALEGVTVRSLAVERDAEGRAVSVTARVRGPAATRLVDALAPLVERRDVEEIELYEE